MKYKSRVLKAVQHVAPRRQLIHSRVHRWNGQSLAIKGAADSLEWSWEWLLHLLGLPVWCECLAEESPNMGSREIVDDSQVNQNTDSAEEVPESYLNY